MFRTFRGGHRRMAPLNTLLFSATMQVKAVTQGMDDEITSPNQFAVLDVDVNSQSSSEEETISPDDLEITELTEFNKKLPDFKAQINYYRSVQQFKYKDNKG